MYFSVFQMQNPEESERLKAKIKRAYELFDKDGTGSVIQEEVSTMMRYLGAYPSEKDMVEKVLPDIQEDEPLNFVTYEKFEKKMLEVLRDHEYAPDTDDTLLRAFRVLDTENRGYIEAETMREILCTEGTPFRDKEIDAFMNRAKDGETGKIYYEDYVALLCAELENDPQASFDNRK